MTEIAQILSWPVPERVRLALFHAATTLPAISSDVTVNMHAHDPLGRPGVAVIATPPHYPGHYEPDPMRLIFDRATGALPAQPGFGAQGVVIAQGVTNSVRELPKRVSPVRAATTPPEPPMVSISPNIGTPSTVLEVEVTAPPRTKASTGAPRFGGASAARSSGDAPLGSTRPLPPRTVKRLRP